MSFPARCIGRWRTSAAGILALVLAACGGPPSEGTNSADDPLAQPPIQPSVVASPDEALTWGYRNQWDADLDGDGSQERVTLTSDVTLDPGGVPLWEDGHRWAAYVESPAGRTLIYSAFVPNGFVEAAILAPRREGSRPVLILERNPEHLRVLEIEYLDLREARLLSSANYPLESWLAGHSSGGALLVPLQGR